MSVSSSNSNPFLDAFFTVDTDECYQITVADLKVYMENHNYDLSFVQKWLRLFDKDGDGCITFEEYCETLGLIPKEARIYREYHFTKKRIPTQKASSAPFPPGVSLIWKNGMREDWQHQITKWTYQLHQEYKYAMQEVVKRLRQRLHEHFEQSWHVVVTVGQYWSFYSHEMGFSLHFKLGRYIFLVWKTPYYG